MRKHVSSSSASPLAAASKAGRRQMKSCHGKGNRQSKNRSLGSKDCMPALHTPEALLFFPVHNSIQQMGIHAAIVIDGETSASSINCYRQIKTCQLTSSFRSPTVKSGATVPIMECRNSQPTNSQRATFAAYAGRPHHAANVAQSRDNLSICPGSMIIQIDNLKHEGM